jgi:hypothetical protein
VPSLTSPAGTGRVTPHRASPGTVAGPDREDRVRIPALALKRRQWEPYAFATPALILIAIVIVFPLVYSF